jgi:response regulator RpfG family c-di-GMP phosphodiesterase
MDIPYCHHEHWNGSGYPRGLKGEDIPIAARLFSVVDVWDALLSNRTYSRAWKRDEVIQYIKDKSGKEFDPEVVDIFLRMEG